MKKVILALVLMFLGQHSFALQAMNCSNAERTFVRVEEEIWGANPIYVLLNGEKKTILEESFVEGTKVVLSKVERSEEQYREEVFAAQLLVKFDGGTRVDYVICKSWSNNLID